MKVTRNITIGLDEKTKKEMGKYPEVNWSEIARKAIKKYIASIEASKRYYVAVKSHETRGTYRQKTENE
jgi:hypothetical protein